MKPIRHYNLTFIFVFPSMMACSPCSKWNNQTQKNHSPTLVIFVERLGKVLGKTFSSNASTCHNFTFGPRSHDPFKFFLWPTPLQKFKWSLTLRCARKYVHAMKAFAPLTPNFVSLKNHSNFASFPPFNVAFPYLNSLINFQLDKDLKLSLYSFKSTFMHMCSPSKHGPFGMVF